MHVLATLLPLAALAAANGRLNFNAFDHANCQGFEENYSLNPATGRATSLVRHPQSLLSPSTQSTCHGLVNPTLVRST
jgi:hypothetical protein